jgi:hypothetical protein
MLRHKRLNEVIATDTYFANEKSIEVFTRNTKIFSDDALQELDLKLRENTC